MTTPSVLNTKLEKINSSLLKAQKLDNLFIKASATELVPLDTVEKITIDKAMGTITIRANMFNHLLSLTDVISQKNMKLIKLLIAENMAEAKFKDGQVTEITIL